MEIENAKLMAKIEKIREILRGIGHENNIELDEHELDKMAERIATDSMYHPRVDSWEWYNIKRIVNDLHDGLNVSNDEIDRVAAILFRVAAKTEIDPDMEKFLEEIEREEANKRKDVKREVMKKGGRRGNLEDFGLEVKEPSLGRGLGGRTRGKGGKMVEIGKGPRITLERFGLIVKKPRKKRKR